MSFEFIDNVLSIAHFSHPCFCITCILHTVGVRSVAEGGRRTTNTLRYKARAALAISYSYPLTFGYLGSTCLNCCMGARTPHVPKRSSPVQTFPAPSWVLPVTTKRQVSTLLYTSSATRNPMLVHPLRTCSSHPRFTSLSSSIVKVECHLRHDKPPTSAVTCQNSGVQGCISCSTTSSPLRAPTQAQMPRL